MLQCRQRLVKRGQLLLLQPLNFSKHAKVLARITLLDQDVDSEFDPQTDSKAQILADLKLNAIAYSNNSTHYPAYNTNQITTLSIDESLSV